MTKLIHVAVAILQQENQQFLLASRPAGKPWAGWWEFPGGKVEPGELPEQALARELQEELGILPIQYKAWKEQRFDYPETHDSPAKSVHLYFFLVTKWQGQLASKEGQALSWQVPGQASVAPILPANTSILGDLASLADTYRASTELK